jgi:hypothetical protein
MYHEEADDFLLRVVVGDEIWIYHFEPESNDTETSLSRKKLKMSANSRKSNTVF